MNTHKEIMQKISYLHAKAATQGMLIAHSIRPSRLIDEYISTCKQLDQLHDELAGMNETLPVDLLIELS